MERVCVYTCLFGQYEHLNEQPTARHSSLPHICFTDDTTLKSETWEIRQVTPRLLMDPLRSHRILKLKPWEFLPEFDLSLYIDNSVILKKTAEEIISSYDIKNEIGIAQHSHRDKVLDEFLEVARLGFDDQTRIFEQLNHYLITHADLLKQKPFWGGMLIRNHHDAPTRLMADIWLYHVLRYSRRDQLSLNLAIHESRVRLKLLNIDNFNSDIHEWPISRKRNRYGGLLNTAITLNMPVAVRRLSEIKETEKIKQLQEEKAALVEKQKNYSLVKTLMFSFLFSSSFFLLVLIKYFYF